MDINLIGNTQVCTEKKHPFKAHLPLLFLKDNLNHLLNFTYIPMFKVPQYLNDIWHNKVY